VKKFIRFLRENAERYGTLDEEDTIRELKGDFFGEILFTGQQYELSQVKILPPCQPSKIVAVGLNYRDHARELELPEPQEPLLFLKPISALIGHNESIIYPQMSQWVEYEGELGVVIGKQAKGIGQDKADEYIFGYTCVNDVTARDLQKKDGQWTRAKSFDTFAAVGPYLVAEINSNNLNIKSFLNGRVCQSSNTSQLIFNPSFLVSFISRIMTLVPGDVISTGTPAGVGPMHAGDVIEIEIEHIGRLRNRVASKRD